MTLFFVNNFTKNNLVAFFNLPQIIWPENAQNREKLRTSEVFDFDEFGAHHGERLRS